MKPKFETLEEEVEWTIKRLDWLGCRSTGSDRLELRLAEIYRALADAQKGTLQTR